MIVVGTALGVTLLVNLPRAAGMLLLGAFMLATRSTASCIAGPDGSSIRTGPGSPASAAASPARSSAPAGRRTPSISRSAGSRKEQFRATMGLATMTSISLRVAGVPAITGLLLDRAVWLTALVVVPAALLGLFVARRVYRRISRDALARAVAFVLLASGSSLVWRAAH